MPLLKQILEAKARKLGSPNQATAVVDGGHAVPAISVDQDDRATAPVANVALADRANIVDRANIAVLANIVDRGDQVKVPMVNALQAALATTMDRDAPTKTMRNAGLKVQIIVAAVDSTSILTMVTQTIVVPISTGMRITDTTITKATLNTTVGTLNTMRVLNMTDILDMKAIGVTKDGADGILNIMPALDITDMKAIGVTKDRADGILNITPALDTTDMKGIGATKDEADGTLNTMPALDTTDIMVIGATKDGVDGTLDIMPALDIADIMVIGVTKDGAGGTSVTMPDADTTDITVIGATKDGVDGTSVTMPALDIADIMVIGVTKDGVDGTSVTMPALDITDITDMKVIGATKDSITLPQIQKSTRDMLIMHTVVQAGRSIPVVLTSDHVGTVPAYLPDEFHWVAARTDLDLLAHTLAGLPRPIESLNMRTKTKMAS